MDTVIRIIADGLVIPIILAGGILLLVKVPNARKFASYSRILMAGLTSYLIAKFVASVYQPTTERPFEILGVDPGALYLNNPGFPSDHALFVAAIFFAVLFEVRSKWISIALGAAVFLVCLGRVLALVHAPADVIAGVVIAAVGAVWYIQGNSFGKAVGAKNPNNRNKGAHPHGKSS